MEKVFSADDEPITISEISGRLNVPEDKLRRTLRELRRRAPNNPILQSQAGTVRKQWLTAATANRLARFFSTGKTTGFLPDDVLRLVIAARSARSALDLEGKDVEEISTALTPFDGFGEMPAQEEIYG